ncbi:permease [Thermosipho ferrireducens]|uniref:Permease n=1 Tax=Thermosipho ferrireducens TaxID=2571116 RepID=A0ABX7S6L3_9BACT|nr:permease [Thermosipho ferrireducens]QTA37476.1 permease [Thermosipho ferrireducens]
MLFFNDILMTILYYLKADWYILLIGILLAVGIVVYLDPEKVRGYLAKNSRLSIPGSVGVGAFTPLCACGTMAVILAMFASAMPWGPVMAFLVSSPLTSPSEFMFQTAFFGTKFAVAVLISSIFLGLSSGFIAHILDRKTTFFKEQFRTKIRGENSCCGEISTNSQQNSLCCTKIILPKSRSFIKKYKIDEFVERFITVGIKKILLLFILFIAIGRVVEMIVPQEWIMTLFSAEKAYSIILGATIGLPLYISGSASLPLMRSFMNSGAGEGAIMAFLITGKATGIPVIMGMSIILKKRAILFYLGFIYLGGILSGYLYQLLLDMGF